MKQKNSLWGSIPVVIVAVIAILALIRGSWQLPLLLSVFALWGLWAFLTQALPKLRIKRAERARMRRAQAEQAARDAAEAEVNAAISDQKVAVTLLRHVNHRISAQLKAQYPDAYWEWTSANPTLLAVQGGIGRIRLSGVPDHSYADVELAPDGRLSCALVKAMAGPASEKGQSPSQANQAPMDPQVWYETQGREVMEALVADLASRGHSSLTIREDGSMDGLRMGFQRVTVPPGGALQFEIPTEDPDNPEYRQNLVGVILFHHPANAYWPDDENEDENTPPQCQSVDGKIGLGNPGGLCASCGYNRFGSSGRGKACKNQRMVYVLQSNTYVPLLLALPPTSLKPFNDFVNQAFMFRRRGVCSAVVQFGLKKMSNGKDTYSVITLKRLYDLEGEELAKIRAFADQFREQARLMLSQSAEQVDVAAGSYTESGAPARRLPDNEDHFAVGALVDGEREPLPA